MCIMCIIYVHVIRVYKWAGDLLEMCCCNVCVVVVAVVVAVVVVVVVVAVLVGVVVWHHQSYAELEYESYTESGLQYM